jgi:hypothetical protein
LGKKMDWRVAMSHILNSLNLLDLRVHRPTHRVG